MLPSFVHERGSDVKCPRVLFSTPSTGNSFQDNLFRTNLYGQSPQTLTRAAACRSEYH